MLVPFVVLQYPLGALADKKTGEKEWLLVAIIIMAIFTGTLTFIHSSGIIVWAVVLFMTRVGAAIMEVMRDTYFYKKVSAQDVDLIDLFRTTRSLAYVISMIISGLFLLVFPLQSIFIILALIILTGLVPLWSLKDTK
jgi:MFS family permease